MNNNFLQLNSNKTEALLIGTPHQVQSSPISQLTFDSQLIPLSSSVTNLGVRFDPHLSFNDHIKHLCKTSFYHLRNISRLRPTLTLPDAEKLVHAFISSRLDYCNGLFIGFLARTSRSRNTSSSESPAPSSAPWETEPFARPHHVCGTTSLSS